MPTVIVYWSPGRTAEQKANVIQGITESLAEHGGAQRKDVLIIFQDIQTGDAGRGGRPLSPATQREYEKDPAGNMAPKA